MAKSVKTKIANKQKSKKFSKLTQGKRRKRLTAKDGVRGLTKKIPQPNEEDEALTKDKPTGFGDNEEIDLSDEDLEDIDELSFLSQTNFEDKRKSKQQKNLSHKEETYEKQPRKLKHDEEINKHVLLPIKSKDGVITRIIPEVSKDGSDAEYCKDVIEEPGPEDYIVASPQSPPVILSTAEVFAQRHKKITEKKTQIAQLCGAILENPEANISKLKELNLLCEEKDKDIQITVKKLVMLSLLQVYKDIIPGYRIRELSEEELSMKVSKDIKKLRDYEKSLLSNYQKYLSVLEKTVQDWMNLLKKQQKIEMKQQKLTSSQKSLESALHGLSAVAMQCMCDLLKAGPHFNYRTNLITVIVQRMNNDLSEDKEINNMACETVKSIFISDLSAEVSLEIVQVLTKMIKSKAYKVQPCVLECLLSLKIRETDLTVVDEKQPEDKKHYKGKNKEDKLRKMKMSKKEKKRQKELKKLDHELKEAEAVENKSRIRRKHTEIIKLIFATYFRILKHARHSPLLSAVLEGLAKFAHLINVDFFMDLMSVLQTTMTTQELNHKQNLNCVLTAFKILSGQGEALNIDPRGFYSCLYKTLLYVHAGHTSDVMPAVLQCLDIMLDKRKRQISLPRIMAFIKRICTISLQLLPHSSMAALVCAKSFLQFNQRAEGLLDSESFGSGVFLPESDDPESSNADNTTLWELATLTHHFHPTVQTYASHVAQGAPPHGPASLNSDMSRLKPTEIFTRFSFDKGQFNPDITPPNQHRRKYKKRGHSTTSSCEEYLQPRMAEKVKRTSELIELIETIEFPDKPRLRKTRSTNNV